MKALGRAAAAALLGGLLGAVLAALVYAWHATIDVEFDRDLPRNLSGVYPPERDRASGLTFAWTSADAVLRLPGLDRRVPWTLTVRVRGARRNAVENPTLTIAVDGATLSAQQTTSEFSELRVMLPPRPDQRGARIEFASAPTFVPGPTDPRPLGVMLDRITLAPQGIVLVPYAGLRATSIAAAAMGAAFAIVGITAGSAIGGAVLLAAAVAAVTGRGFAPFSDFSSTVIRLGVWTALVLAGAAVATVYVRGRALRNTARFAAAFSASAAFLKLLVLLHPNMPVGDAMFHAHRFQGVLAGHPYFTSIAPGGYNFPYPPGLYLFAALFSGLAHRGAEDMTLLRIVAAGVDAAFGLLIYWTVVRNWNDRLAGAMAVAIYHLIPLNFGVLTTGNLTNAFAQSVAIGALAMAADPAVTTRRWTLSLVLTLLLAVAFMSHTGTLAILFLSALLTAVLFAIRGGHSLRSASLAVAIATIAAGLLAVALYYAWFMDTYRTEFARIGHETAAAAPDAGGRTIGDRLRLVPFSLGIYIGAPVLLFALLGGVELALRRPANRLTLTLAGWTASCAAFLVLGVLTPIDMRYYLAALPVLAIAAAYGASWAWNEGRPLHRSLWRLATAVFLAATISAGFHHWWSMLG